METGVALALLGGVAAHYCKVDPLVGTATAERIHARCRHIAPTSEALLWLVIAELAVKAQRGLKAGQA